MLLSNKRSLGLIETKDKQKIKQNKDLVRAELRRDAAPARSRNLWAQKRKEKKYFTYLGGMFRGERGFSFSMSFFSRASRGGRIFGLSFSSRFIRSLSHSSFRRILSFSRSCSRSLSRSLCRRSRSRWSRSLSLSRFRSRGSRSRSRSLRTEFKVV